MDSARGQRPSAALDARLTPASDGYGQLGTIFGSGAHETVGGSGRGWVGVGGSGREWAGVGGVVDVGGWT